MFKYEVLEVEVKLQDAFYLWLLSPSLSRSANHLIDHDSCEQLHVELTRRISYQRRGNGVGGNKIYRARNQ